jgi:hypothetical protein
VSAAACHRCRKHKRVPLAMLCGITGKNIVLHARADYCPLKLFGTDQAAPGWDEAKPVVTQRPPMPIPEGFDPEAERRRMQPGGCCGSPSTRPE